MSAVTKIEPPGPSPSTGNIGQLMAIIDRATTAESFDIAKIQQLLELKERWEAAEAKKAFTVAMAEFKADPPKIFKNKHVAFKNKSGGTTEYDHATHSEVTEKIAAGLGRHGLSHSWNIEQKENQIRVTCIITHSLGHSASVAMTAAPDDSGSKSAIQAVASTCTLLQRYTLIAATGLTSADLPDADDRTDEANQYIGEGQIANIKALLTETNANEDSFLRVIKAPSIDKIHVGAYLAVVGILEAKRKHV